MDEKTTGPAVYEDDPEAKPKLAIVSHEDEPPQPPAPDAHLNIDALVGQLYLQNAVQGVRIEALLRENQRLVLENGALAEALLSGKTPADE